MVPVARRNSKRCLLSNAANAICAAAKDALAKAPTADHMPPLSRVYHHHGLPLASLARSIRAVTFTRLWVEL